MDDIMVDDMASPMNDHGLFKNVEHCIIGAIPAMFSIIGSAVALVTAVLTQPV